MLVDVKCDPVLMFRLYLFVSLFVCHVYETDTISTIIILHYVSVVCAYCVCECLCKNV